jgi:glycosyltransferase involved in cell wall biosynthesis
VRNKKITVIPNGIDTDVFCPRDTSALRLKYGARKVVVHVTQNFEDKRKGGRYVLELAQRMPDVSFFILGNNKPLNNLPPNVCAIGRTENQAQLAEWYSFADISLITSKKETFSMVCAECLACGTPVVGFDAGAPPEVAPEGYGAFASYPDIPDLESVLQRALNGEMRGKADCAAFGKAKYAKEVMAQRYIELYNREMTQA